MTKNIAVALFFALATAALLGFIWFGQTAQRLEATNERTVARELEFGQRNYEQYCATCHGLAGDGAGPTLASAPALNNLQETKGPGTSVYTMTNGIGEKYGSLRNYVEARILAGVSGTAMPAWRGTLRNDQVSAVSAYVMAMQGGAVTDLAKEVSGQWKGTEIAKLPPSPTPDTPPATPLPDPEAQAGLELFNGKGACLGCHKVTDEPLVGPGLAGLFGPDGTKAYGAVLPNGKPVNDADLAEWIHLGGGGPGVGPQANDAPLGATEYGAMPAQAQLSDAEIVQIIAYLKTLER